jgi:hypothetical protein
MNPQNARSEPASLLSRWAQDLRLRPGWGWRADLRFALALLGGVIFWLALAWRGAPFAGLVSLVLPQPLFTALHFIGHPPLWAAAVLLASLLLFSRPPRQRAAGDRAACFLQRGLFSAAADLN